jgi:hypothetical protein
VVRLRIIKIAEAARLLYLAILAERPDERANWS